MTSRQRDERVRHLSYDMTLKALLGATIMKTRLLSYCFTTLEEKKEEMSVRATEPIVETCLVP